MIAKVGYKIKITLIRTEYTFCISFIFLITYIFLLTRISYLLKKHVIRYKPKNRR